MSLKKNQLESFLTQMDNVIYGSTWNVVSVDDMSSHGLLRLWVFVTRMPGAPVPASSQHQEVGCMFSVQLRMPRTIYINSRVTSTDPKFKRVTNKLLPRHRPVHQLYEW